MCHCRSLAIMIKNTMENTAADLNVLPTNCRQYGRGMYLLLKLITFVCILVSCTK